MRNCASLAICLSFVFFAPRVFAGELKNRASGSLSDAEILRRAKASIKCEKNGGKYNPATDMCELCRRSKQKAVLPPPKKVVVKRYRRKLEAAKPKVVEKVVERVRYVQLPSSIPAPVFRQEQKQIVNMTPPPTPPLPPPAPKPVAVPAPVSKPAPKWLFVGPGIFALGTWAGEKDFITGGMGKLAFAINQRFRVAGVMGAGVGPWQDGKFNLFVGAEGSVRLWNGLFLVTGVHTFWGGFDGLSVHRRMIFAGVGPEYWVGDRMSVSLQFEFGVRDDVRACATNLGSFNAGNLFQLAVYF